MLILNINYCYRITETEQDESKRLKTWDSFLESEEPKPSNSAAEADSKEGAEIEAIEPVAVENVKDDIKASEEVELPVAAAGEN